MQEGDLEDERESYEEVHVYAERGAEVAFHREEEESKEGTDMTGTKVNAMHFFYYAHACS